MPHPSHHCRGDAHLLFLLFTSSWKGRMEAAILVKIPWVSPKNLNYIGLSAARSPILIISKTRLQNISFDISSWLANCTTSICELRFRIQWSLLIKYHAAAGSRTTRNSKQYISSPLLHNFCLALSSSHNPDIAASYWVRRETRRSSVALYQSYPEPHAAQQGASFTYRPTRGTSPADLLYWKQRGGSWKLFRGSFRYLQHSRVTFRQQLTFSLDSFYPVIISS